MRAHWQTVAAQEAAHRSCRRWTCEREKRQRCICVGKSPPRRTKGVANTALDIGTFAVAELAAACKEQLRTGATNVNTDATKIVGRGSVPSIYPYRGCVLYSITGLGTRQGLPPVRAARAASRVPLGPVRRYAWPPTLRCSSMARARRWYMSHATCA